MSSKRFIKLITSEKADYLQESFPNCFLLFSYIARHAVNKDNPLTGLKSGDCIVGSMTTSKKAGLTRSQYRTALQKLKDLKLIKTVYKHKFEKPQNLAIKIAIKSELINIIDSDVYDVRFIDGRHQNDHLVAIQSPYTEIEKKDKKDKKDPILPFLTEIENHLNRLELRDGVIFYVIEKMKQSWKSGEIKARNPAGLIKYAVTCARSRNAKIVDESVYEKEKDLRNGTSDSSSGLRGHREELTIQNRKAAKAFSEFQENGLRVIPREFFMEIVEYRDFKHNFQEFDWSSNAHYHKKQCNLSYSDPNWNEIVKDFHTENEKIVAIQ